MELNKELHGNWYSGANKARSSSHGELSDLRVNLENGTFQGTDRNLGITYSNLQMKDFYFYEFH